VRIASAESSDYRKSSVLTITTPNKSSEVKTMKRALTRVILVLFACCYVSCGGGGGGGGGEGGASGGGGGSAADPVVVIANDVPDTVIGGKTVWNESALEHYLPVMQA
jgi:hypothetical protein